MEKIDPFPFIALLWLICCQLYLAEDVSNEEPGGVEKFACNLVLTAMKAVEGDGPVFTSKMAEKATCFIKNLHNMSLTEVPTCRILNSFAEINFQVMLNKVDAKCCIKDNSTTENQTQIQAKQTKDTIVATPLINVTSNDPNNTKIILNDTADSELDHSINEILKLAESDKKPNATEVTKTDNSTSDATISRKNPVSTCNLPCDVNSPNSTSLSLNGTVLRVTFFIHHKNPSLSFKRVGMYAFGTPINVSSENEDLDYCLPLYRNMILEQSYRTIEGYLNPALLNMIQDNPKWQSLLKDCKLYKSNDQKVETQLQPYEETDDSPYLLN